VSVENDDENALAQETESDVWYEHFAVCSFRTCTLLYQSGPMKQDEACGERSKLRREAKCKKVLAQNKNWQRELGDCSSIANMNRDETGHHERASIRWREI
jgi:hypothetical protein